MDSAKEEQRHNKKSKLGFQDDEHLAYGLRENPKKSWKFSGCKYDAAATSSMQENQCKVCGKEFESVKALYGHMRHHSGKERKRIHCKECGKSFLSLKCLANHTRVHCGKLSVANESAGTSSRHGLLVDSLHVKRKRSKRKRYKSNASSPISSLNESFSFTQIDQDVEQVALCLLMLSKGVHNWGELYSFCEFSVNDHSLSFEVKSLNKGKQILTNEGGSDGNESLKVRKPKEEKLDACDSDSLNVLYEKDENECMERDSKEGKKDELGVSNERLYRGVEVEMPELDHETEFASYDAETEKGILLEVNFKSTDVASSEDSMGGIGLDQAGLAIMESTSSKKVHFDACDAELAVDSSNRVKCSISKSEMLDDSWKKCEIKCKTCNKRFHSRQALGSHQRMHKSKRGCLAPKIENWEEQNQSGTGMSPEIEADCKLVKLDWIESVMEQEMGQVAVKAYDSRESKEYKCPTCFKVFATGQALGGHKRAHFVKNSESRPQQIAMSEERSTVCDNLDLNIPIMQEQEDKRDVRFTQWWAGNDHKHEPVVSLVAN